jgi:mannitol/fructose-specific phosphotransferase system IIA component (Ntr-type)
MMLLSELLRPELVKAGLEAQKKTEAISELVDVLVQYHEIPMAQRHAIVEEFIANEAVFGSGLQKAIALPHITTDRVSDIICALGTAPAGIPFVSRDDKPARIVLLTLAPKKSIVEEVRMLAGVERLLEREGVAQRLLEAKSGEDIYAIIKEEEAK